MKPPARAGRIVMLAALLVPVIASAGWNESLSEWFDEYMIDEQDGKLDISEYLASARGFFPAPIVITEPALGFGLGAAVAYFHPPKAIDRTVHPHRGPPSISVVFGAGTENGTRLGGGAHLGVWRDDHVRYTGALAAVDVILRFYPDLGQLPPVEEGIRFNVEGAFLFQQLQFRLRETNWWLGGDFLFIDADNRFFLGDRPIDLPGPLSNFRQGGLGAFVEYDGRNTTFTPSRGLKGKLEFRNYDENWGSDFNFDHVLAEVQHFTPFGDYSSLGVRFNAETVSGSVPFFSYPYVNLRGIPALRYQGDAVVTAELEYLWGLTPRWTVALFGGAGRTSSTSRLGTSEENVAAGGVGFRYRIARKLGLQMGIDVARGPEETAVYLTIGNAWP